MDAAIVAIAVEAVESEGRWWVERGGCVGVMQVDPHFSIYTRAQLFNPEYNRAEGRRILDYWLKRSGGRWRLALAAYNCGNVGLKGKCPRGNQYARKVLRLAKSLEVKP